MKASVNTSMQTSSDRTFTDPRILEDVQRALRLKARREARLKAIQSNTPKKDSALASDQASGSSLSGYSPIRNKHVELPPAVPPLSAHNVESEVDFSPSIGVVTEHPVPSSSNGGATLDWTGSASEDERDKRWSLAITKRKHKDKTAFYTSKGMVEKQESLYVGASEYNITPAFIVLIWSRQTCQDQSEGQAAHFAQSCNNCRAITTPILGASCIHTVC